MKNYKTYLFDADGTLLNYDKTELQAVKETFRLYNLTYNQQIEKAEVFRNRYVDDHPVILEGWGRLL